MNITEEELVKIVNSDKCKSVRIDGKNYWISKKVKAELKKTQRDPKEGGFAFLAAIPAIIAGLAGAAGVASGVASTAANSRDAILKQKEIEQIDGKGLFLNTDSKGQGLYLKPYEGSTIHKYLKNIFDDVKLKNSTRKFKDEIEIEISGDGLFLKPYNYYDKNGHSDEN